MSDEKEKILIGFYLVTLVSSIALFAASLTIMIQVKKDQALSIEQANKETKDLRRELEEAQNKEKASNKTEACLKSALRKVNSEMKRAQRMSLDNWTKTTNGFFYKTFKTPMNYTTANQNCTDQGAWPIANGLRNATIVNELKNATILQSGYLYWIGYSAEEDGKWRWANNSTANAIWTKNITDQEECGEIVVKADSPVTLGSFACNKTHHHVCEAPPLHNGSWHNCTNA